MNDPASSIDNQIRALKLLIADLFGIPVDPTSLTGAIMSVTAAGLVSDMTLGTAAPATPVANRLYTDSIVKGWVKFQVDGTIDDDLNVSSVTDNAAGDWTVNWATAFATGNYGVMLSVQCAVPTLEQLSVDDDNSPTTTAMRIQSGADGSLADPTGAAVRLFAAAIGDQ